MVIDINVDTNKHISIHTIRLCSITMYRYNAANEDIMIIGCSHNCNDP